MVGLFGKKNLKIFVVAFILLVPCFFIYKKALSPGGKVIFESKKFGQYYVPVANYWVDFHDIKTEELKSRKIIIPKGEKDNLTGFIGADVVEKETSEIQKGLADSEIALIRWDAVTPNLKTLSIDGKFLWDKEVKDYPLKVKVSDGSEVFDPAKITKITAAGDAMLSRNVGVKINKYGAGHPWEKASISDADITFLNLEVPISDRFPAPTTGMSFIAPTKNLAAIKNAGVDIVSVANNHTANFGYKVFEDNLTNLKDVGINTCGGGFSEKEARTPQIIEKNGIKFGFLCYSSITGTLFARDENTGAAGFAIEPWFRDNDADITEIKNDIAEAKKVTDVVIVSPHWGVEYKVNSNSSQRKVAKAMIEAGADLVLGTHPHVVQGSEMINGKYVTYSLGNFIFDQEWSRETKEGMVLENYFYGKKQVAAKMRPVLIEDYNQPNLLTGSAARVIIDRIKNASFGF